MWRENVWCSVWIVWAKLTDYFYCVPPPPHFWTYYNITKHIRSPPCHHLTPETPMKWLLSSFCVISHLKKCTCPAFMRYHVSFCCNAPFSQHINGKQMCTNHLGRLWGGIMAHRIFHHTFSGTSCTIPNSVAVYLFLHYSRTSSFLSLKKSLYVWMITSFPLSSANN